MEWDKVHTLLQVAHLSNSYDRQLAWLRDAAIKEIMAMKPPTVVPISRPSSPTATPSPTQPSTVSLVPKVTGDK